MWPSRRSQTVPSADSDRSGQPGRVLADGGEQPEHFTLEQRVALARQLWAAKGYETTVRRLDGVPYVVASAEDGTTELVRVANWESLEDSTLETLAALRDEYGFATAYYVDPDRTLDPPETDVSILDRRRVAVAAKQLDLSGRVRTASEAARSASATDEDSAAGEASPAESQMDAPTEGGSQPADPGGRAVSERGQVVSEGGQAVSEGRQAESKGGQAVSDRGQMDADPAQSDAESKFASGSQPDESASPAKQVLEVYPPGAWRSATVWLLVTGGFLGGLAAGAIVVGLLYSAFPSEGLQLLGILAGTGLGVATAYRLYEYAEDALLERPVLRIDDLGIHYRRRTTMRSVPWERVEGVAVENQTVATQGYRLNYEWLAIAVDAFEESGRLRRLRSTLNNLYTGTSGDIHRTRIDNYDVDYEDIEAAVKRFSDVPVGRRET